jgi:hypothetical protein
MTSKGRTFPWGEAMPTSELATIQRRTGDTLPVGSRPKGATRSGLLDMAGSLSGPAPWTGRTRTAPTMAARTQASLASASRVGGDYVFNSGVERLTTWNRTIWSRNPTAGEWRGRRNADVAGQPS